MQFQERAVRPCDINSFPDVAEGTRCCIFFHAFLRLHCEDPVGGNDKPYAEAAVGRRLQRPGWEATSQDGEFPSGVHGCAHS